jgi:hypothetical protein
VLPQRPQQRRRQHNIADQPEADQEYFQSGSIVASSISITGMSSLIGYTRWHSPHLSAVPFLTSFTGVLQFGHARISSNSASTGIGPPGKLWNYSILS